MIDRRDEARALDRADPLAELRHQFHIPTRPDGTDAVYLCGNSLGLQPRGARGEVDAVLDDWRRLGVDGHFDGDPSWYRYDEPLAALTAPLVGAHSHEVAVAGTLSADLHFLLASFYRPSGRRTGILVEADAFPSDRYVVESQLVWHGNDPVGDLHELPVGDGSCTTTASLDTALRAADGTIALVLLGGVNYRTGEVLDMAGMARVCRSHGVVFGLDLAHAAGNVELALHDWEVDFAAWCTYKYLNAGPGAVASFFVHESHGLDPATPRLAGWWGNDPDRRFAMDTERRFVPRPGADGWKVSNPPILSMAPLRASLDLFGRAGGMAPLRAKSCRLTGFLAELLAPVVGVEVLTPELADRRGCQLSLRCADAPALQAALAAEGVVTDLRRPDVVRVAPTPLYNSFDDVWCAAEAIDRLVSS